MSNGIVVLVAGGLMLLFAIIGLGVTMNVILTTWQQRRDAREWREMKEEARPDE